MLTVLRSAVEVGLLYQRIYEPTIKCNALEDSGDPQIWNEGRELLSNIDVNDHFLFYFFFNTMGFPYILLSLHRME